MKRIIPKFKVSKRTSKKETHEYIGKMIGKDLSNSYVRVEICCDRKGFGLNRIVILKKS